MKVTIQEGYPATEVMIRCSYVTPEITNLERSLKSFDSCLQGSVDGEIYFLEKADVYYFEVLERRSFFYTASRIYETSLKLFEVENLLSGIGFFRSSKSQIINISHMKSLRPDFGGRMIATLKNGEELVISRQYAKILKERLDLK